MDPVYWFRIERNKRLTSCDWTQAPDSRLSESQRQEWETYRQALRDLPSKTTPTFDKNRMLTNIKWPTLGECHFSPSNKLFTGQQTCFVSDDVAEEGMIVCANRNKYGIQGTPRSNAITINESTPNVSLCTGVMDKSCFGVISQTFGHKRAFINSVGEGAMWVVNTAGALESGDYITTSNVAGYGQRQESEFLANYTVAKITMDCDFNPQDIPVQRILKELSNVNYWVKTTYSNVSLEEYSNLAEENRRMVEENETVTYQMINREESTTEQEGTTLEVRQELVNVLDEHGQLQWEDDPSGATEKAYKIRYLDASGQITDEANAVHTAAFVGVTYHCG